MSDVIEKMWFAFEQKMDKDWSDDPIVAMRAAVAALADNVTDEMVMVAKAARIAKYSEHTNDALTSGSVFADIERQGIAAGLRSLLQKENQPS